MRIDAYNQIQQLYGNSNIKKSDEKKGNSVNFKDQLMLSATGKDAQLAKQAVANAPDIREELTVPLKEQLDKGTYEVSADDLAGKLLEKYSGLF